MSRKLICLVAGLALAAGTLGTATIASARSSSGGSFKDGPYASSTPDSGTCGNNWAIDLFNRKFTVALPANLDGSYTVTEKFANGRFITHAGTSPESCGVVPTHGSVAEGVSGTLAGSFTVLVAPGATFNPNASCVLVVDADPNAADAGAGECTTAAWVHSFFGTSATYGIPHFNIAYSAPGSLLAHQWVNADTGNVGDIRSA